jgi:23S rRNA pseudouridine1911/1915/1917 synthase
VDGVVAPPSLRLKGDERVRVTPREPPEAGSELVPDDIELDILYEDESIIAVNKAPGLVVHPGAGNRRRTLVNALLYRFPDASWPGESGRPGIVHRLDRDTSGVILIARSVEVHESLSKQFRRRSVEKEYLALVRARVVKPGRIEDSIGRHSTDRKRMSTVAHRARSAVTVFEPVEGFGPVTLLSVHPLTGRTHQIRVHLASRGWPIVGDRVYGGSSSKVLRTIGDPTVANLLGAMPRQALHARRLTFSHPLRGERMSIEAPLAEDFAIIIRNLRAWATK